ncbi:MAG: ATP-binding protein [Bacteroidota bacterium]
MNIQLTLLVVSGILGVMLLVLSYACYTSFYEKRSLKKKLSIQKLKIDQQREVLKATLASQEKLGSRLGTELHDKVGAMLSTIKMNLQVSQRNNSLDSLPEVIDYLTETIGQIRSISHEMMPVILKKYGLKMAIDELFEKVNDGGKLKAVISHWDEITLGEKEDVMLYRIIQELTNNSLKHADAKNIDLSCEKNDCSLLITFLDDGIGFPAQVLEKADGIGLWNIMNRAQAIHADVNFGNREGSGAIVELAINQQNA